jgi:hypothetical protein
MNTEAEAANQKQLERSAATCVHFNGVGNDRCKAGIAYKGFGSPRCLPCLPKFRDTDPEPPKCAMFRATGMEQVLREEEEWKEMAVRANRARVAIVAHAQATGEMRGKLHCPICGKGELHYSIARCNGHVHARCTTSDCVNWME